MTATTVLIIGAGASGLACAACLKKAGIESLMLERQGQVANAWRNHYDRLHLHTSKGWSALPFIKFADAVPEYPSRRNFVEYLEEYAAGLNLHPVFNTEVLSVKKAGNYWMIETNKDIYQCEFVIIATGLNHTPKRPQFEGMNSFTGQMLHSSEYKNGKAFTGQQVLLVGFGNSACEQAICLHEHGAFPSLSVRSPVNVLPRDIFGLPVLEIGRLTSRLPSRLADMFNAPLIRLLVGDIKKLGLKKSVYGPREQIEKQHRIPLLDIGTIQLIRRGHIKVYGDIRRIDGSTVYFTDDKQQNFDTIIFGTGYAHNLESILDVGSDRLHDARNSMRKQIYFGKDGLYFCGFFVSPVGMLHEIGLEATKIAEAISAKVLSPPA